MSGGEKRPGRLWLTRDADGRRNAYALYRAASEPVLGPDGIVTTLDEADECLGAFSPDEAPELFGVTLAPGECLLVRLRVESAEPPRPMRQVEKARKSH